MNAGLKTLLEESGCSCVIANGGVVRQFHRRGVADLLGLLHDEPGFLRGAEIADKVVGKGAAALMILGGIKEIYAAVLSKKASELLSLYPVEYSCGTMVDGIINRQGTGPCPVEALCAECSTAEECLPLIEKFVSSLNNK